MPRESTKLKPTRAESRATGRTVLTHLEIAEMFAAETKPVNGQVSHISLRQAACFGRAASIPAALGAGNRNTPVFFKATRADDAEAEVSCCVVGMAEMEAPTEIEQQVFAQRVLGLDPGGREDSSGSAGVPLISALLFAPEFRFESSGKEQRRR